MKLLKNVLTIVMVVSIMNACKPKEEKQNEGQAQIPSTEEVKKRLEEYAEFTLTADISSFSDNQKEMLRILFQVADIMDQIYWKQEIGDKEEFLGNITDPVLREYARINYGPWDALREDAVFIDGYGERPPGVNLYPADITKEEFENLDDPKKDDTYSIMVRDENDHLTVVPNHEAYPELTEKAAGLLEKAAEYAEDEGFEAYLKLRAKTLRTDEYLESDLNWMDMKTNQVDFVVGAIETYEDQLFGYRASYNGQILIKDMEWSKKLERFAGFMPQLQKDLPVPGPYKQEEVQANADINVYDAVYYAGDCNKAVKNIAINLPNDPRVQQEKGSRRLQLRNSMQAKFDKILVPISKILITEEQQKHVKFDAFFENTMFHEVAHGLGIKNTINGKGDVRLALKEHYSSIEEGKSDILGLFFVTKLHEWGEYPDKDLMDNYVTFMAGIFRSVRFGATSAHGAANMIRFNYFQEQQAFTRDEETGMYRVDFEKMKEAMLSLANKILVIQGDGDYEGAGKLIEEKGKIGEMLQKDLERIAQAGIPRDIIFKQGPEVLGL